MAAEPAQPRRPHRQKHKPAIRVVVTRKPRGRSPKQIVEAEQKAAEAYTLWLGGGTLAQIAQAVGYTEASTAKQAIDRHRAVQLAEIEGNAFHDATVALHKVRVVLWAKVLRGDDQAIRTLVRVMEREAKMLGLDAPVRLAMGGDADAAPIRTVSAQLIVTPETAEAALRSLAEAGVLPDGMAQAWVYAPAEGQCEG